MGRNLTHKILEEHLVTGKLAPGTEIGVRIDQTLTQDATGTMAYLQFEAMGVERVKTELSVSYVDHNMLQSGFENADDHRFLQSVAARYGIHFSRPGNGICHQVHRERFGVPGKTLLGSDSHTPTGGGLGMIAMGAGGLDVAAAMAGYPFHLPAPHVVRVVLEGRLPAWVTGKDVILEMLQRLTVKGGTGRIFEYVGEGAAALSCADRFTICNMGAELGATTSLFPSDEETRRYLQAQGRENVWRPLAPDADAAYDQEVVIDLGRLEPLVAQPHNPDRVVPVREVAGIPVVQSCIGSCTNSSYEDLMVAAAMLRGRTVDEQVSLSVNPGSRQVFEMIAREGALADLINAGARVLEASCGPCIGMGQSPPSGSATVRSFNRNFHGRSGTRDADVYLGSVETCVASALKGVLTDPRDLGIAHERPAMPERFIADDRMIVAPPADGSRVEIVRGPNIKPLPKFESPGDAVNGRIILKTGDNISTDHIMPAGSKILPLRSNIPAISRYVFQPVDEEFPARCEEWGGGIVVGGQNYGQGSSREHAALAPRSLGLRAVIVQSFARIHRQNLVNFGILPLTFAEEKDYRALEQGDELEIPDLKQALEGGSAVKVRNVTRGTEFTTRHDLSPREREVVLAGGLLNFIRSRK